MYDHILIRYGEINTKGQNRSSLEQILLRNVQSALRDWPQVKVSRISNRMLVQLHGAPTRPILDRLTRVFGISSMSPVALAPLDPDRITDVAIALMSNQAENARVFKVEVRRGNKRFPMDSPALARHVGGAILQAVQGTSVDVHQPDVVVQIDVRDQAAYLFVERVAGAGGFPIGMSGRGVGLLSGGIDSPVAIWQSLKRGMSVDLVHFHSYPFTSERALRKVDVLATCLASWSGPLRLHIVSMTETQTAIRQICPESLRTIILRRMMFRVCSEMAKKHRWLALVTGDSLGQVASQTMEAVYAVDAVTHLTVFRPLVMEDKLDIIAKAQKIDTYETSILPYDDCCSLFAPKHPKTHPTLLEVEEAEIGLDVTGLVHRAVASVELKICSPMVSTPD